ncbi:ThiF family adenylyltransferase [Fibrobacter sp.]|uniref:ThiF family adenylyltransferase n=1 Tax=Fibrobacter sp. TaxID=35828 RepID=UPI002601638C|nr:ThiF family adenylyltransferase [Fibrobacter sp.]MDD5941619.1 ThiF family adenylyltransferase [Fibrobacter sp.]
MKDSPWENLKDALAAWNFIPCSGSLSAEFEGPIESRTFGTVIVKLLFDNQCCTEFPRACLARQYDGLCFRKVPHVEKDGGLCYLQKGELVFDACRPYDMVGVIVDQITERILDLSKEKYWEEFSNEMPSYWPCDYSAEIKDVNKNSLKIIEGNSSSPSYSCPVYPLSGHVDISALRFPFGSMKDLLLFGKASMGKRAFKRYRKTVLWGCYSSKNFAVAFRKNATILGLIVLPSRIGNLNCRYFAKESENKLFSRNVSMENSAPLMDKRILVVGSGTLGSNLLPMLVKSGAGFKNPLTIVDPDKYAEENFSRHYLGLECLGVNKALAMKAVLENHVKNEPSKRFKNFRIESIEKTFENAFKPGMDFPFDIVLDTTGDESFSEYLNRFLAQLPKMPLYICGYIYGRSKAVCASVISNSKKACLRCEKKYLVDNAVLPKLGEEDQTRGTCNAVYIPFPITASVSAANLIMTALFKSLDRIGEEESLFWFQACVNNVWNAMECVTIPKDGSCPACCRI